MSIKLCGCGCGQPTKKSNGGRKAATPSGQFRPFIAGHHMRGRPTKWYRRIGSTLAHRARAEKALGKPLPPKAVVHHADGSKSEFAPLVICENQAYHGLLHTRMRVKQMGGNPNTDRVCAYCQQVKPMSAFKKITTKPNVWHCLECGRARHRAAKNRMAA
jgi:hypothetical protein